MIRLGNIARSTLYPRYYNIIMNCLLINTYGNDSIFVLSIPSLAATADIPIRKIVTTNIVLIPLEPIIMQYLGTLFKFILSINSGVHVDLSVESKDCLNKSCYSQANG